MVERVLKVVGAGLVLTLFSLLMAFVLINFMLGCESWDEQYWTAYNSCITPSQFIGGFFNYE